ncbi:hypothetical protein [Glutamicibacter creatinolyticus]|uniref:hypothetical protein n=1 Tax=Glutamicibacter creatinolyticus TaxID=162496 RepID=UPI0031DC9CF5
MSGYQHGRNAELAAARTVYDKARIQAARIIAEAEQQAQRIISTAKIHAESEANLIREKARTQGLAQADAHQLETHRQRKQEAQARLRAAASEATGYRRLKDTA